MDDAFPRDLHERIGAARARVWVQFMTFEGDAAGEALTVRLLEAKARGVDVRIIVDRYTDMMVSDTFHKSPEVRDEVAATRRMWVRLGEAGIPVVRTRPLGPLNVLFLFRGHKKIVVVDDAVYLGGVNISDHNLSWHDFMVRFDDPEVTAACAEVFEATCGGEEPDRAYPSGVVTNRAVEGTFDALLGSARNEVVLSAPYMADLDLVARLKGIQAGVRRVLLTSHASNLLLYRIVNGHVFRSLAKAGCEVWLEPGFRHARFLVVDAEWVFVTSSNLGRESLRCKDEIGVVVRDRAFAKRMLDELVRDRMPTLERLGDPPGPMRRLAGWSVAHLMHGALRVVEPIGRRWTRVLDP